MSLEFVDTNTGVNYSLQTNNVVVGQPMNLTCQFLLTNSIFMDCLFSNFQWTIPGYAISNYVVAPDASSAVLSTNFPTTNSTVKFYWVDGASNRIVQCAASYRGLRFTNQAVFNVIRPLPQFFAPVVGSVTVDTNYDNFEYDSGNGNIIDGGHDVAGTNWLHFGTASSWADIGIAFIFTNAPTIWPTTTSYGRYFMVQVIETGSIEENCLSGTNLIGKELNQYGLDTEYPLQATGDFWHLGGYSYRTNDMWFDCPASVLDETTWVSRTNSFTAYLMFQAAQPIYYTNNIPIPMYSVTWSWSGIAKTNSSPTGYYLYSSTLPSTNISQTFNFPTWNTNSENFIWQTNTTPFNEN
jgi:hypothetical protein